MLPMGLLSESSSVFYNPCLWLPAPGASSQLTPQAKASGLRGSGGSAGSCVSGAQGSQRLAPSGVGGRGVFEQPAGPPDRRSQSQSLLQRQPIGRPPIAPNRGPRSRS